MQKIEKNCFYKLGYQA